MNISLQLVNMIRKMLSLSPTFSTGVVSSCEVALAVKTVTLERHNVGLSKTEEINKIENNMHENKVKLHLISVVKCPT